MNQENENEEMSAQERRELKKEYQTQKKQKARGYSSLIWGVVIVALVIAGFILMRANSGNDGEISDPGPLKLTQADHTIGPDDAVATLVEYGDFQCPACGFYAGMVKQLSSDYPEDLKIAYRHLPLTNIHLNAVPSALASEAAARQDKFWEMYDLLYTRQDDWSEDADPTEKFIAYAGELGLDVDRFREDYKNQVGLEKIQEDVDTSKKLSVRATPTFFLNGEKLELSKGTYQELSDLVQSEIGRVSENNDPTE